MYRKNWRFELVCETNQYTKTHFETEEHKFRISYFLNNKEKHADRERLFKVKPLSVLLKARFKSVWIPDSIITIDKITAPCKGRLLFKQYILGKSYEYDVKVVQASEYDWIKLEFYGLYWSWAWSNGCNGSDRLAFGMLSSGNSSQLLYEYYLI